jgi:hypothetical protein
VAHGSRLERPMEAFPKTIGGGMVGSCLGKLYASQFGQRVKKFRLELSSLVGGEGLRETKAGIQPGSRACAAVSAVIAGMDMASGLRVKRSTALRQYVNPAEVGRGPMRSM